MKLSKSLVILSSAAVGLTMVTGEDGAPNCTPTKAQQILRQKMTAMDGTAKPSSGPKLPSKVELLTEVQRLHQEGKITDQQSKAFRKNINDQYAAAAGPISTEAVARVQPGVDPKPAPPNAAEKAEKTVAPAPKPTPEPRAQAPPPQTAPAPKPAATPKPPAAPPQKLATPQPERKPAAPTGALTPEQEAKARESLRAQIAAGAKQGKVEPVASVPDANAQAKALAVLRQQQAAAQPAPSPRPVPKAAAAPAPAPKPEPVPDPHAQAKALAVLRQQQAAARSTPAPQPAPAVVERGPGAFASPASTPTPQPVAAPPAVTQPAAPSPQQELEAKVGIGPDTPGLTKVLRVKVAELEGTVPPQQAEQIIAPLVAPPALSESNKQGLERLAELTDLYKANRITPAQYHQERAKIVATLNK